MPQLKDGREEGTSIAQIVACLRLFVADDQITELRILNAGRAGTVSGYFSDIDCMAKAAAKWSGRAPAVYFAPNPINPALLARAKNRLLEHAKSTTGDADITRRRWLLIDFDPKRPSGISATDVEHQAAIDCAVRCRDWLSSDGWPSPILADSGNGAHLNYLIDLPNDQASTGLIQQCLKALDWLHSDDAVEVDITTFNAGRLLKLYGTMACRGDSTPDRSHRIAKILKVPERLVTVPVDLLAALAARAPEEPTQQRHNGSHSNRQTTTFDLERWIAEHNVPVVSSGSWKSSGKKWILNPCPWNQEHTNRSAFIVRWPDGTIGAGCKHKGCAGRGWHALRDLYEPDRKKTGKKASAGETSTNRESFCVGSISLQPSKPRQTHSGKIIIPITLVSGSTIIDHVLLANSVSGRSQAARLIAKHCTNKQETADTIDGVLARIIADAAEQLKATDQEGATIYEIVKSEVPKQFGFAYRTDRGAWSETRRCEVSRSDFVCFVPSWLLDLASTAVNAPLNQSGNINRTTLLRAVRSEIEVVWSDLMERLPWMQNTELKQDTAAGKKFREAMVRLWTATRTFEVSRSIEGTSGEAVAARASLLSRAKTQAKEYLSGRVTPGTRERWREVQKAFSAWWRPYVNEGELTILLAMRWELVGQIGIELPGVSDQASLTALGTQFGVLETAPPVTAMLSGGAKRLAELSLTLVGEMLEDPTTEDQEEGSVT